MPCIGYRATGIVAGGVREFLEIPIEYEVRIIQRLKPMEKIEQQ